MRGLGDTRQISQDPLPQGLHRLVKAWPGE